MDLSQIEVPDTATIHIEHPTLGKLYTEDKQPCEIVVYGPASDKAMAWKRRATKIATERLSKGLKGFARTSPSELEAVELERLVTLTADVHNIELGGEKITAANVRNLYSDPKFGWLRDQVAEKLGSWEDFLS